LRIIAMICIVAGWSGCLRFVPARTVSNEDSHEESDFFAIEKVEQDELQQLLKERAELRNRSIESAYRIGAGDLIDLRVFDVPEVTGAVRVRPDGMISVPLIGDVTALGRTEEELQRDIVGRLRRFIVSPTVTIAVNTYEGSKVSVIGEVVKPGAYPLRQGSTSLVQILSEAGGRTARAASHLVLLPVFVAEERSTLTSPESRKNRPSVEIDLDDLLGTTRGGDSIEVFLVAGDTIVVPEAGTVQVDGEVAKPGSHSLSSKESIVGAIAAAGGVTYSADVERVEVIREVGNGRKASLAFNLQDVALKNTKDIRLRNGDVVRVPSARGRFATRQVVEVLNRVFNVNVVQ
jgi:polysaccharide export outer membrane protein